jgi:hypothetical protein
MAAMGDATASLRVETVKKSTDQRNNIVATASSWRYNNVVT